MDHQQKAFVMTRDMEAFGLFMEQGTGKTKVTIDTACYLWQRGKIEALVIVAWPNGVHQNWIEYELPVDMSVPYLADYWSDNHAAKYRGIGFKKWLLAPRDRLKVFAFNVECFVSEKAQEILKDILESHKCLFVIDQSASIKNPQAKRTKFLVDKASRLAPFRRILDGAPVAEGADELYSQFKFLDPQIIGHDTWTGFKREYCEIGWHNEIKGYKNIDRLRKKIDGFSFRCLADDCLDLPRRIYKAWPFDLEKEEKRIWGELNDMDLASFREYVPKDLDESDIEADERYADGEFLEADLAIVKNMRLQQIASGWWPKDGDVSPIEDSGKPSRFKALQRLLAQAPGKAIIFSRFRKDLELIARELGDKAVSYHGGISGEDRARAKRLFMTDDRVQYFIGQPRSAGIGHTLTAAKHVIFYSNDPSLRLREECEKRAHRTGLKHTLLIWDLIARGTHDRKTVRSLRDKKDLANIIMNDPQSFFLIHEND